MYIKLIEVIIRLRACDNHVNAFVLIKVSILASFWQLHMQAMASYFQYVLFV